MKKLAVAAAVTVMLGIAGFAATSTSEPEPTIGHQQGPALSSEIVVGHVIGPSLSELAETGDLP